MAISPYMQGLGMGASLIMAIGAQNAFVLSQSIRRNHHIPIAATCIACDWILISLGVLGFGSLVMAHPQIQTITTWGGVLFLLWFGFTAFRSALRGGSLKAEKGALRPLKTALAGALAVSLLNPHAYLDTVVLLGGLSTNYEGVGRYYFGAGALTASFLWFCTLSMGGKALAPLFKNPTAWRVLDGIVCLMVWSIAVGLIYQTVKPPVW